MTPIRLLGINFLIRMAAAGSGQLFAFLLARRLASHAGTGALLVGFIGAAYFMTELAGAPLAGRTADQRGQTLVLRWGPLFGIVSSLVAVAAAGAAESLVLLALLLFLARLSEGASAACAVPTTLTLLSRATDGDPRRRTRVMGAFEATSLIGMIAGYVLLGVAWDGLGIAAFLILPPLYAAAWWLVPDRQLAQEHPAPSAHGSHTVWGVLRKLATDRANVAFGVAWLAVNGVVGLWVQQTPFLLTLPERSPTQRLVGGFGGQDVGVIFAAWGGLFLAGIGLWSWLAPGWPRRRAMAVALVAMAGVVASLAWMNHGGPDVALWLAALFVMVEAGFAPAAFAHLGEITRGLDASRGTAMGLYSVLLGAGQLAGNVLGGPFSARWQMDGVLLLTALLGLISLAGVVGMGRARRPAGVEAPDETAATP